MPHAHGTYLGGIRSIEDLRARCKIDDICGCWLWQLSAIDGNSPKVHVRTPEGNRIMRGRRAAVYLSGRRICAGQVAYPADECRNEMCVNPDHACVGSKALAGAALRRTGRMRNIPSKIAAARKAWDQRGRKITPEMAAEIRSSTESTHELAKRMGLSQFTIWSCRVGQTHKGVVAGASAFTWRP